MRPSSESLRRPFGRSYTMDHPPSLKHCVTASQMQMPRVELTTPRSGWDFAEHCTSCKVGDEKHLILVQDWNSYMISCFTLTMSTIITLYARMISFQVLIRLSPTRMSQDIHNWVGQCKRRGVWLLVNQPNLLDQMRALSLSLPLSLRNSPPPSPSLRLSPFVTHTHIHSCAQKRQHGACVSSSIKSFEGNWVEGFDSQNHKYFGFWCLWDDV